METLTTFTFETTVDQPVLETQFVEVLATALKPELINSIATPTPKPVDTFPQAKDNPEVQQTIASLKEAFARKVRINNISCSLEKITFFRRRGGWIIDALITCPSGEVIEVPFKQGKIYSSEEISNHIARCLIAKSIGKALGGGPGRSAGMRINKEFYTVFKYHIEPVADGNKTTLVIYGNKNYYQVELPVQEKFTRQEILTAVATALMDPEKNVLELTPYQ